MGVMPLDATDPFDFGQSEIRKPRPALVECIVVLRRWHEGAPRQRATSRCSSLLPTVSADVPSPDDVIAFEGRHVFFGLRSISVYGNSEVAGTFKYLESESVAAGPAGSGDGNSGPAITCKVRKEGREQTVGWGWGWASKVACVPDFCVCFFFCRWPLC